MKRSLRIAQVTNGFPPSVGGVETYVYNLSVALARRGHHVEVFTHNLGRSDAAERVDNSLREKGVLVHRLRSLRTGLHKDFINSHFTRINLGLIPMILGSRPDIVDSHSHPAIHSEAACLASEIAHVPYILHVHGMYKMHRVYHYIMGERACAD